MSQAVPYSKANNFTQYATANPAAPYQPAYLDAELASIELFTETIQANLVKIQADDGFLLNAIVTPSHLSEQTRALMASNSQPRGNWVAYANYTIGDAVSYTSLAYLCTISHTAGASFNSANFMSIGGDNSSLANANAAEASAIAAAASAVAAEASAVIAASSASAGASAAAASSAAAALVSQNSASSSASASSASAVSSSNSASVATTKAAEAASSAAASISGGFTANTRMSFNQPSAPTGWTKDTTAALNDSIMRIVTGTTGSGGSTAFSTFNGKTATDGYTLAIADMPSHDHQQQGGIGTGGLIANSPASGDFDVAYDAYGLLTKSRGGGGAHSHGLTHAIKYNDFIIASKN